MSQTLIAIDGNNLLHRAYWAIPPMTTTDGRHTNAVYGFLRTMFKLVSDYKPGYLTVAFDVFAPTKRHDEYAEYKGGRQSTPDDLIEQFATLKHVLEMLGIRYLEKEGYEADDILGTLSRMSEGPNYLVSGDKDVLQLVSPSTTVVFPRTTKAGSEIVVVNEEALEEKYGLKPSQIPDLKGLMGDASDNIPGVKGVGEKTALKLLHAWGTVANLYDHIDELPKNKMREKLIAGKEDALMSERLTVIDTDVPLDVDLSDIAFSGYNMRGGAEMAAELQFRSLVPMFTEEASEEPTTGPAKAPEPVAAGLDVLADLPKDEPLCAFLEDGVLHAACAGKVWDIPAGDKGSGQREKLSKALRDALAERSLTSFDVKGMMHEFPLPDSDEPPFRFYNDLSVADWVLNPSQSDYRIAAVLRREGLAESAASFSNLWSSQSQRLRDMGLEEVYTNIEMPLLGVLYTMERSGVLLDPKALDELGVGYDERMASLEEKIYELAGGPFNIGSPKQLSDVLFEKLGLPHGKKTRSGYSTDASVLESLRAKAPIAGYILDYRALSKLKNTYVNGLLASVHEDGYVHTTFLQTATSTGRLSSTDPNLQNIPVRSDEADRIRKAFSAPEGYTIVSADYSQIELRVLADVANDASLRAAFERGEDIHARTAAEILGKDISEVTKDERSHAKAVNFGIVYGISDFGLSRSTGLTRTQARRYIDSYLARFPGVQRYMDEIKKEARSQGFVRTLYGRVRYIPDINSKNFNLRTAAERAALNMPIQGTAADIMKLAMIRAQKAIRSTGARLVLQVHDELIAYAPDAEVARVEELLRDAMEGAATLSVPLKVNTASGKTWLEAK